MEGHDAIFSAELPIPKGKASKMPPPIKKQEPVADKPKRKYERKMKPETTISEKPEKRAVELPQEIAGRLEVFTHSFGVEYLGVLERLLALIGEPQRAKLLDFIIDNKIV